MSKMTISIGTTGTEHALKRWDWTCWNAVEAIDIAKVLKEIAPKWVFQQEMGDEKQGIHYQGRLVLFKKVRLPQLVEMLKGGPLVASHLSPTSNNCKGFRYVMKAQGRVAGPWKDTDPDMEEMPREIKGITLYPWQQTILNSCHMVQERRVNVLIDVVGGLGKSTLKKYLRYHRHAAVGPPTSDKKALMAYFIDYKADAYVFDLPRDFQSKKSVGEFWSGIEAIKDGYGMDPRYKHRECQRSSPVVWILTNTMPDLKRLTCDRWALWIVSPEGNLIKYREDRLEKVRMVHDIREGNRKRKAPTADWEEIDDLPLDQNILKMIYN